MTQSFSHRVILLFHIIAAMVVVTMIFSCSNRNVPQEEEPEVIIDPSDVYRDLVHSVLPQKASQYKADSRYMIIVDYSIPSNKDRLFLWDSELDQVVERFWCAHGMGGESTSQRPEFSNTVGSNCSSLGCFLVDRSVGVSYHYGYSYHALDGLDPTNSNARRREILIHPSGFVSRDEAARIEEPMQLDFRCAGCFTVSDTAFETLDRYFKETKKRILLLAIDGLENE